MKPRVLIVSDSAAIDTGFGRVAREIGSALALSGRYEVAQHGWYHLPAQDKLIPFLIYPTDRATKQVAEADQWGQLTYDEVVGGFKPDIVLTIGDTWMVEHIARRPRNYKLVGYVPIDSVPIPAQWLEVYAAFDLVVTFGKFGTDAIRAHIKDFPLLSIPHGVDADTFRPLPKQDPAVIDLRAKISNGAGFLVGCVARNTGRKNLPRLLKAFKSFISPWRACLACGRVDHGSADAGPCQHCGGGDLRYGPGKDDARLYLHCDPNDPHGFKLAALVQRFGLVGRVGTPVGLTVGRGCPDEELNLIYNAMDLFTLPTTGEGFGLPIAEAMAAGTPVLVTNYSGHLDFVHGAGATIEVSEFETFPLNNCERAIVDLNDYEMKLDQFYYETEDFWPKWETWLVRQGMTPEQKEQSKTGGVLLDMVGRKCRERIGRDMTWKAVCSVWEKVFDALVEGMSMSKQRSAGPAIATEVIQ